MGIFTRENIKATQAVHDHQSSEESGLAKRDIEMRVTTPTGVTGRITRISSDGKTVQVMLDPKPGEEDLRQYAGDPEKTEIVHELLKIPPKERDAQWEEAVLASLPDANMDGGNGAQPVKIKGPDGLPYIRLDSPKLNIPYRSWVIRHILPNVLNNDCGVVINLEKEEPDWVLSYGDLVNIYLNGKYKHDDERFEKYGTDAPNEEVMAGGETVSEGEPSDIILPAQVRGALRRFLEAYGFPAKVKLMQRPPDLEAGRRGGLSLVFTFTDEIMQNEEEKLQYVSRAISWYLPRYYSVLWTKDGENFVDL